jgi:hypothetical protein
MRVSCGLSGKCKGTDLLYVEYADAGSAGDTYLKEKREWLEKWDARLAEIVRTADEQRAA